MDKFSLQCLKNEWQCCHECNEMEIKKKTFLTTQIMIKRASMIICEDFDWLTVLK